MLTAMRLVALCLPPTEDVFLDMPPCVDSKRLFLGVKCYRHRHLLLCRSFC